MQKFAFGASEPLLTSNATGPVWGPMGPGGVTGPGELSGHLPVGFQDLTLNPTWGLYRDYYRDPFPHSQTKTRQ